MPHNSMFKFKGASNLKVNAIGVHFFRPTIIKNICNKHGALTQYRQSNALYLVNIPI